MTKTIYLELPWKGIGAMIGDIVGFIAVTILLISIDSYILCKQQNAIRIMFSIGIDYFILFVYMAIRNIAMADRHAARPCSDHRRATYAAPPGDYSKSAGNYSQPSYSTNNSAYHSCRR